jgi:signal transduction histidine kinase
MMAKVLVVDDAVSTVRMLTHMLKHQGYEVLPAYSGQEGLDRAAAERPDAILLDLMMPGMDGIDVCRRLKADTQLGMIPVILVTAKDMDEDVVRGLDAGADDYVTKPLNHQVLIARLRAAIRVKEGHDLLAQANENLRSEIRERLKAEETLRKKDEELRQSQKLEALGLLAGGVAHEFNNALQAIIGYSEAIQGKLCSEDASYRYSEQILEVAGGAANIARQLLGFSRQQRLEPEYVDANQVVADLAKLVGPILGKCITLSLTLGAKAAIVHADAGGLQQALLNLCLNARDAMPNGGQLTISTANAGPGEALPESGSATKATGCLLIGVADTGCGMLPEVIERIFDPFYTTKGVGKGSGLGLALVHGIVQQHGGTIRVSSEPGNGTAFTICLPTAHVSPAVAVPSHIRHSVLITNDRVMT